MTREDVTAEVLQIKDKNILLELATSVGKTRLALEITDARVKDTENPKILIVYPKVTLKDEWQREIAKWHKEHLLPYITFTTYASLKKHFADDRGTQIHYNMCIFDECHHLSEAKRDIARCYKSDNNLLLSATVGRKLKGQINILFKGLHTYRVAVKDAIESDILPDPKVVLIPLKLINVKELQDFIINPKAKKINNNHFTMSYNNYWRIRKEGNDNYQYHMRGTCTDYHNVITQLIEFYRRKQDKPAMKNRFLKLSGERLEWLSTIKNDYVLTILSILKNYRTLTFCSNIKQADILGKNAIHSKNKKSDDIKKAFNDGKIKHITAVEMLSEGANLVDCKFGIWARYNTSETLIPQKIGRLLRHKEPYIILPYFEHTREEEIVKTMIQTINPSNIIKTSIENFAEILK